MKTLIISMLAVFFFNPTANVSLMGTVVDQNGQPLEKVTIHEKNTLNKTWTDQSGRFTITVSSLQARLIISKNGYVSQEIAASASQPIRLVLSPKFPAIPADHVYDQEMQIVAPGRDVQKLTTGAIHVPFTPHHYPQENAGQEEYAPVKETGFKRVSDAPLSTFSVDVDRAAYSNVRRFLNLGQMPPKEAVRIEEMINYFDYQYDGPAGKHPFAIHTELVKAPWENEHLIARIGIQGRKVETKSLSASNLVFLIDVSGSMDTPNRLPLVKSSFKLLLNELRPEDKVAIVVYAGAAGLVLPSTSSQEKQKIIDALDNLKAGGSTAGGAGLRLAYQVAKENYIKGGNNRVIIATDGDFNVGESSNDAMEKLITEKREDGVFLTVLGFGMGNYKDAKMEILANKGNGNYAYIDNLQEAKKVLVNEFAGTLFTIAKDVKLQVEFNPAYVQAYRLIGYENRRLKDEEFNDDRKDAGDIGSGHTVTALYEIVPVGAKSNWPGSIDALKYQQPEKQAAVGKVNGELLNVKVRYKEPDSNRSILMENPVMSTVSKTSSENTRWAVAVAAFGLLLSESDYVRNLTYDQLLAQARAARGRDEEGYRAEMIRLIESAMLLTTP